MEIFNNLYLPDTQVGPKVGGDNILPNNPNIKNGRPGKVPCYRIRYSLYSLLQKSSKRGEKPY